MAEIGRKLLSASANATGSAVTLTGAELGAFRGTYTIYIYGTWNSATAKVQISPDGTNWFDVPNGSWTSDTVQNIEIYGYQIRGVVSGGGGSESITIIMA